MGGLVVSRLAPRVSLCRRTVMDAECAVSLRPDAGDSSRNAVLLGNSSTGLRVGKTGLLLTIEGVDGHLKGVVPSNS
jgi:hypothetical protein